MAFLVTKLLLLLLFFPFFFTHTNALDPSSATSLPTNLTSVTTFCNKRPYPDACFNSLKLSISITINPNIISFLLQTLQTAISEAEKLTSVLSNAGSSSNIIENQRGAVQDCQELHQITLTSLQRSASNIQTGDSRKMVDARAYLSASLTNKNTCLEGLDSATGPLKPELVNSLVSTYQHVSNSLSMIPKPTPKKSHKNRRLLGFPTWVSRKDRRFLMSSGDEYDPREVITVAADGSGNFSSVSDAIDFAPKNSEEKVVIYVKEGVYEENVVIPSHKPNIVLLGAGADATYITGNRSVGDGWTTYRSATLAVSGEGFLARDISIVNSAGPEKHQAVAVRLNSDLSAMYRCSIYGYQDTLYVHSFRQFYRECDIYGTVDYIFGNAAVVLQGCNIVSRLPMPGQFNVITAQSRDSPDEDTGISMQNCSILATEDLYKSSGGVKSFLGRPWKTYSRTVLLESYVDGFINPEGWAVWSDERNGLDTLYYGEYQNYGPGSGIDSRVDWAGYHVMDYDDASTFTVSYFIAGDEWLDSTSFPYDDNV